MPKTNSDCRIERELCGARRVRRGRGTSENAATLMVARQCRAGDSGDRRAELQVAGGAWWQAVRADRRGASIGQPLRERRRKSGRARVRMRAVADVHRVTGIGRRLVRHVVRVRGSALDHPGDRRTDVAIVHVRNESLGGEQAETQHQEDRHGAAEGVTNGREHQRIDGSLRERARHCTTIRRLTKAAVIDAGCSLP